jgi:WhiB family redox-sensing transcriptional regulator
MFMVELGDGAGPPQAYRVCARCPVRGECLDEAVAHNWSGIWGGTNQRQRLQLRRRRRADVG